VAYEESPDQIMRNMESLGLDLKRWIDQGKLEIMSLRPTSHGLEDHLSILKRAVEESSCKAVIVDPIGTLGDGGTMNQAHHVVVRMIDLLKSRGITTMLTNLTHGGESIEQTAIAISSLVDTWLLVKTIEANGERNRGMYVLKSRGMAHSNQIREFVITSKGVDLVEPYVGPEGVLTGTARFIQESRERIARLTRQRKKEGMERLLTRKRAAMEEKIAALEAEFEAESIEISRSLEDASGFESELEIARQELARQRGESPIRNAARSNGKAPRRTAMPRSQESS
jgi:circadian clock protein KaiC